MTWYVCLTATTIIIPSAQRFPLVLPLYSHSYPLPAAVQKQAWRSDGGRTTVCWAPGPTDSEKGEPRRLQRMSYTDCLGSRSPRSEEQGWPRLEVGP